MLCGQADALLTWSHFHLLYSQASFLADARLLAQADAFVGTGSWTSRILLLAMVGGRASIPPYVMLDGPLGHRLWGGKGKDCSKKVCT